MSMDIGAIEDEGRCRAELQLVHGKSWDIQVINRLRETSDHLSVVYFR